jgi:hypothetical protein
MIDTALIIQAVNEFERCGRLIAAGLGLVKLRERYDTWWRDDLPPDERTWRAYTAKHMRFGADRADFLLGRMTRIGGKMRCTRCGTESGCPCACGAAYVPTHRWARAAGPAEVAAPEPTALARAMAAIAAHPERSNRAIAKEIGLSEPTLRRARQKLAESPAE